MPGNQPKADGHAPRDQESRAVHFEFVLIDNFSMMSVITAIEALRVANRMLGRTMYRWSVCSELGRSIKASNGLVIESTTPLSDGAVPDYTFVVAGLGLLARNQTKMNVF